MNNIQSEILTDFRSARRSIKIAVSWLTDTLLINELINSRERGIDVKVIVSNHELNIIRFELFRKIIELGGIVNKEGSSETEMGNFMHYKFYIIDDRNAKSGSYNMTLNAATNREALDNVEVTKKLNEFNSCLKESVHFFKDLQNPEEKRKELLKIEKLSNDILTPEKLAAYRNTQAAIKEQEERHRKEIEEKERQRIEADKARIAAERKAESERIEKDRIIEEQRTRQQQSQYEPKKDVKVTTVPPTSYGKQ